MRLLCTQRRADCAAFVAFDIQEDHLRMTILREQTAWSERSFEFRCHILPLFYEAAYDRVAEPNPGRCVDCIRHRSIERILRVSL